MNTIAVWYERKSDCDASDVELDLHFNLWKVKEKKWLGKYVYFLDIGLKIEKFKCIDNMKIYFPFEIKKDEISDLGKVIQETNLIGAIFNEEFKVNDIPNKKFYKLEIEGEKKGKFSVYKFDPKADIEVEKNYGGSVINLKTTGSNYENIDDTCYFRMRIKSSHLDNFTDLYTPKFAFFQSAFSQTDVIDFRVNEKRNLDKNLLEKMDGNSAFRIKKIHFLLLRNARDNFVHAHSDADSCRVLEEEIWERYIDFPYKEEKIIAYHWKKKAEKSKEIESFNAFIKTDFENNNIKRIAIYLIVIAFLSVAFNLTSSYIYETYFSKEKPSSISTKVNSLAGELENGKK